MNGKRMRGVSRVKYGQDTGTSLLQSVQGDSANDSSQALFSHYIIESCHKSSQAVEYTSAV